MGRPQRNGEGVEGILHQVGREVESAGPLEAAGFGESCRVIRDPAASACQGCWRTAHIGLSKRYRLPMRAAGSDGLPDADLNSAGLVQSMLGQTGLELGGTGAALRPLSARKVALIPPQVADATGVA